MSCPHWWVTWNEVFFFFFFFYLVPGCWVWPMSGSENNAQHTVGAWGQMEMKCASSGIWAALCDLREIL